MRPLRFRGYTVIWADTATHKSGSKVHGTLQFAIEHKDSLVAKRNRRVTITRGIETIGEWRSIINGPFYDELADCKYPVIRTRIAA